MKRILAIPLVTALLAGGLMQPAGAQLAAVGPVNPENGFPVWYQDTDGLRLELCLEPAGACLLEQPDPAAPIAFPDNFGPEAFWWLAEAFVDADGISGQLVLAMEAAFVGEEAAEGDQVAFARIRLRIDVPVTGTYTVTHPFGSASYQIDAVGAGREINETQDVGNFADPGRLGDYTLALADGPNPPLAGATVNADGRSIGPFLRPSVTPGGVPSEPITFAGDHYLSIPTAFTPVTGSPLGPEFNVFRIEGPGGRVAQTTAFVVMGKLFATQPARVDRAEYRLQSGKFTIEGSSVLVVDELGAPTEVTIYLGDDASGTPLGTASVDAATGHWRFSGKAPVSPGGAARSIAVTSTADPDGEPTVEPLLLR